mmetsp:Transcript_35327/g.73975  ORF Transcript_35327/g.73975 Transcript_35327/m.73975 type:complete len:129 (-) Transcript_35327:104-490(-)
MYFANTSVLRICFLICLASVLSVQSAPRRGGRSTPDRELRIRRGECEKDACAGFQNEAKLMCTYRCINPECNEEVYGKDEIEEGEVDADRGRQFAACFRRLFKKEQDELMRQQREERLAKKREAAQVA